MPVFRLPETDSARLPAGRDLARLLGVPEALHHYFDDIRQDAANLHLDWGGYCLSSVYQPIVSLSHGTVVAHEALLRVQDSQQRGVSPATLFTPLLAPEDLLHLDRASRLMHMANVLHTPGCYFLNLHPGLFEILPEGQYFAGAQAVGTFAGITESRYIIEIVEEKIVDPQRFEQGVAALRAAGFGVALDDFGAGHSNFDRVWKMAPDVVKLDASFATRAAVDRAVRRMLPQIVSLLHEAGTLVLLEGIETRDQARIAMDANIDFGQGWYFSRPASDPIQHSEGIQQRIREAWDADRHEEQTNEDLSHTLLVPYLPKLRAVSERLRQGQALADAAALWMDLPHVISLYLLDTEGRQSGRAVEASVGQGSRGFCLGHLPGARWERREHFLEAIRTPGEPVVTRPYRSVANGRMTVTLSHCIHLDASQFVLCADIDWQTLEATALAQRDAY